MNGSQRKKSYLFSCGVTLLLMGCLGVTASMSFAQKVAKAHPVFMLNTEMKNYTNHLEMLPKSGYRPPCLLCHHAARASNDK